MDWECVEYGGCVPRSTYPGREILGRGAFVVVPRPCSGRSRSRSVRLTPFSSVLRLYPTTNTTNNNNKQQQQQPQPTITNKNTLYYVTTTYLMRAGFGNDTKIGNIHGFRQGAFVRQIKERIQWYFRQHLVDPIFVGIE